MRTPPARTISVLPAARWGVRSVIAIKTPTAPARTEATGPQSGWRQMKEAHQFLRLSFVVLVLFLGFSKPLYDLVRFALKSDLYSHIVLIPFISAYLVWIDRGRLTGFASNRSSLAPFDEESAGVRGFVKNLPSSTATRKWVAIPLVAGFVALALFW